MSTSDTITGTDGDLDQEAAEAFAGRLFELFTDAALSSLIDIGRRISLFEAATAGPATSADSPITLTVAEPFDVAFVFNSIHDQARPAEVLRRIHDALVPDGTFVMDEPRVSSRLEDNIGNPLAPFTYAVSTLHCLTLSLAEGGAGLGTAWGEELAVQMLRDAGFGEVAVHAAPGDPGNAVFVTARPR